MRTGPGASATVCSGTPLASATITSSRPWLRSVSSASEAPSKTTAPSRILAPPGSVTTRPAARVRREPAKRTNRRPEIGMADSMESCSVVSPPRSPTSIAGSRAVHSAAGPPMLVGTSAA